MTPPVIEILSQGDEIIEGTVINTNAAWLSRQLTDRGLKVMRHTTIGDDLEALAHAFREIAERSTICISSGGLGPTVDDLTAEAAARAFESELREDPEALRQIEQWFERSGRTMPQINRRQALLPLGARRLDNDWGTAPGFVMTHGRCQFFFLPGVPQEMMAMFEHRISPWLDESFSCMRPQRLTFHTIGIGESALQEKLATLSLPSNVQLGFRAKGTENEIKIHLGALSEPLEAEELIERVSALLGDAVFSVDQNGQGPDGMAALVGKTLRREKLQVLVLESLSGGNLSRTLSLEGALASAEIHPASNSPLPIEDAAVIEHELKAQADHLLRKQGVDSVIIERWYPDGEIIPGERSHVVLWTLAATDHQSLIEKRELAGFHPQLSASATLWSLNTLRKLLES